MTAADSQLLVTSDTKASNDGAQIYLREMHTALLDSTHLTKDKIQRDTSSSKEQPTTPPESATLGAMDIKCISRPAVVSHDSASNSKYGRALLRAVQDRRNELTHIPDTSDNTLLYAGSGQWERERTLPTMSYLNGNMPTTGYNYSLQTNKKSITGEPNELPDKTALAKLKEVGDLIVISTQKELPVIAMPPWPSNHRPLVVPHHHSLNHSAARSSLTLRSHSTSNSCRPSPTEANEQRMMRLTNS